MVASLERRFKIFSELVKETKQAAPLIFCVVCNYHLCHKKWVGHKKWGNETEKDFRWRNGESKSKADMRHVSVAISGRPAAGEVVPGYFHFMPARAQGAVKPPWHRPVWSHVPHALGDLMLAPSPSIPSQITARSTYAEASSGLSPQPAVVHSPVG